MSDDQKKPFLRSVFSGNDGAGSLSRVASFLIVISAIGWVTFLVIIKKLIPELGGLTVWVTSIVAALYGTNKVAGVMSGKKDGQ